jgi:hypothetical protein
LLVHFTVLIQTALEFAIDKKLNLIGLSYFVIPHHIPQQYEQLDIKISYRIMSAHTGTPYCMGNLNLIFHFNFIVVGHLCGLVDKVPG